MKQGQDFSKDFPTDKSAYILNEAAVEQINYEDPVGRSLTFWGKKGTIIGVEKNFHFASLHDPIRPLIIRFEETDNWGNALVKMDAGSITQGLKSLGSLSRQLNPKFQFRFQFLGGAILILITVLEPSSILKNDWSMPTPGSLPIGPGTLSKYIT